MKMSRLSADILSNRCGNAHTSGRDVPGCPGLARKPSAEACRPPKSFMISSPYLSLACLVAALAQLLPSDPLAVTREQT